MNIFIGPGTASTEAHAVNALFFALLVLSGLVALLVVGLIVGFGTRFRENSNVERHRVSHLAHREFEIGWTVAVAFLALFFFWWAASYQVTALAPPSGALEIHVEAKQWMWKTEHPNGAREINALHVPVNQPVVLYLNSQDVIHSFYVPAFRLKQDVVPGRTATAWFEADRTGTFPLRCAEYCGTSHARMLGEVTVMEPAAYARWSEAQPQADNLAEIGRGYFTAFGCSGCHSPSSRVHAPQFEVGGLFGRPVELADGRTVIADQAYIRNSILQPKRDIVAGFAPIMPGDYGQTLDEGEISALVAYIRSLGAAPPADDTTLRSPDQETSR